MKLQKTELCTSDFEVAADFVVEKLFEVPKEWGSWDSLTKLANGDLAASDQYGGIYRVLVTEEGTRAERLEIDLTGCRLPTAPDWWLGTREMVPELRARFVMPHRLPPSTLRTEFRHPIQLSIIAALLSEAMRVSTSASVL
ncbi:hypothetical protein [Haloferula sp.]|uniref:hypothetical protein n=1 Tax=Haloferula sp. TaxID=2497595 RepID=UPI003C74FAB6